MAGDEYFVVIFAAVLLSYDVGEGYVCLSFLRLENNEASYSLLAICVSEIGEL